MAVESRRNQYRGINAHLHSLWQGIGRWNRFHNVHIGDLLKLLKVPLLPMGYTAEIEESLQIRRVWEPPYQPRADILVTDLDPSRSPHASSMSPTGAQIMTIGELIEDEIDQEHPYSAIAIYQSLQDAPPGVPVAWIELLSPSNKGGSLDAQAYRSKRAELLRNNLVFVEIDYLHETPPTFWRLPDYTRHEPKSQPYQITVLEPRPEYHTGKAYLYAFDVDMPIPKGKIPLNAGDVVEFDFGIAYQKTFDEALYGYGLDYSQLPLNFDRYGPADQQRIAARMLAVLEAARDGVDLDGEILPVKDIPLNTALAQMSAMGYRFRE
jgi:hypothetical protein